MGQHYWVSTNGAIVDIGNFEICPGCRGIRGEWVLDDLSASRRVQTCRCGPPPDKVKVWAGFDHNTAVELCRCCALVPLRSGSKFSVWLCDDCRPRVTTLRAPDGALVVPISRHSLMHGIGHRPGDGQTSREFHGHLMGFFDRIDHLREWMASLITENLSRAGLPLDEPVGLRLYCQRAWNEGLSKEEAFAGLCHHFGFEPPSENGLTR